MCLILGYSKQAYYKQIKHIEKVGFEENLVVGLINEKRKIWQGSGRNLHQSLKCNFEQHDIKIGRDKFFKLLKRNGFLKKTRSYKINTTNSYHHFHKYPNLIRDIEPIRANEVWVSDITYIRLIDSNKFCYLYLITDMYSRKIIGYSLSENLTRTGAIAALKMAMKGVPKTVLENAIHHSDRGIQYCCYEYTDLLKANNVMISMTENGDPLENAIAERINKTIKEEFTTEKTLEFNHIKQAESEIKKIITFYNNERPHRSIAWNTPAQAHLLEGFLERKWKSYFKHKTIDNVGELQQA